MALAIELKDVTKAFGEQIIIKQVSTTIKEQTTTALIGKNGSGKTTLLNLLTGNTRPSGGCVNVAMQDRNMRSAYKHRRRYRRFFGFGRQEPSFYETLSIRENLEYFCSQYGLESSLRKENIEWLLDALELQPHAYKKGKELSGGMRKRLDIACSLVHRPSFAFFDEPTADLDPSLRSQIWRFIGGLSEMGITVIFSTHDMEEISTVCDQVIVLEDGWLRKKDSPSALLEGIDTPSRIRLTLHDMTGYEIETQVKSALKRHDEIITVEPHLIEIETPEPARLHTILLDIVKDSTSFHLTTTQAGLESLIE